MNVVATTPARRHLVVMLKAPRLGQVKTRLAAGIGATHATRVYRSMVRNLLARLYCPARWHLWLAVSPLEFIRDSAWLHQQGIGRQLAAGGISVVSQGSGNLGARMWGLLAALPGERIIIGSDIVGVSIGALAEAFARLAQSDYVIGPGDDGGYWLIGIGGVRGWRRAVRAGGDGMLREVRWSSPYAMADTVARLGVGRRGALARQLSDIDNAADLKAAAAIARHCPSRLLGALRYVCA